MPQSSPTARLKTLTSHLAATPSAAHALVMPATRPPITCHILDTLSGLPARNIPVTVELLSPTREGKIVFEAVTNDDGRIPAWTAVSSDGNGNVLDMQALFETFEQGADMKWVARFDVLRYFADRNIKPFFPEVEIRFLTSGFGSDANGEERGHWHVPLLLGPYSYTTYRGS
ncbi:hydroxyisourate hydrolase [Verruconis gallopava]|uniref:hydroxyisourate hydrolase n=1 Tax=Verruconis gallopava TaxID=253628 RepID=A0A0D1YN60_9PEZI|nr:hydroxyisourate hydrolase [Verruconis gallopava]KIW02187.1 hydroxyisourate hydrolase [Verruconis gallopava]